VSVVVLRAIALKLAVITDGLAYENAEIAFVAVDDLQHRLLLIADQVELDRHLVEISLGLIGDTSYDRLAPCGGAGTRYFRACSSGGQRFGESGP
jgi:hypothetical protein